jgi:hypothetical protein
MKGKGQTAEWGKRREKGTAELLYGRSFSFWELFFSFFPGRPARSCWAACSHAPLSDWAKPRGGRSDGGATAGGWCSVLSCLGEVRRGVRWCSCCSGAVVPAYQSVTQGGLGLPGSGGAVWVVFSQALACKVAVLLSCLDRNSPNRPPSQSSQLVKTSLLLPRTKLVSYITKVTFSLGFLDVPTMHSGRFAVTVCCLSCGFLVRPVTALQSRRRQKACKLGNSHRNFC